MYFSCLWFCGLLLAASIPRDQILPFLHLCPQLTPLFFVRNRHRDRDATQPTYMKIRNKPFPWEASDCGLFDLECKRRYKAAKAAAKAAQ